MKLRSAVSLIGIGLALSAGAGSAQAAGVPWWHLTTNLRPATLQPGGEGTLSLQATNIGDAPTSGPMTLSAQLPAGTTVLSEGGAPRVRFATFLTLPTENLGPNGNNFLETALHVEWCRVNGHTVTCSTEAQNPEFAGVEVEEEPLVPFMGLEMKIHFEDLSATAGAAALLSVSGGGAPTVSRPKPLLVGATAQFGAEEYELVPEEEGGAVDTSAGSHPFQLTASFGLNQEGEVTAPGPEEAGETEAPALARNLAFRLPPGQIGNVASVPKCPMTLFTTVANGISNLCPASTVIGAASVTIDEKAHLGLKAFPIPLFNLEPGNGEPARFGLEIASTPIILDTSLRSGPGEDYGVTVDTSNISQAAGLINSTVTFWGAPGDPRHDEARGWGCIAKNWARVAEPCLPSTETKPRAFLTLPTSCEAPYLTSAEGLSWPKPQAPGGISFDPFSYTLQDAGGNPLALTGCNQLGFDPKVAAKPTAQSAAAPSGLEFDLNFEDEGLESSTGLAESDVKRATVTLPKGVTTNPAVANGLAACSLAQYREESLSAAAGCPEASKIGEVEIESPLVEPIIHGSIYVARQHDNPANNLLSVYMVAKSPELGVLVRSAGSVTPDPQTGQLTTTFGIDGEPLPQLPFSHFHLSFRSGPRAPLITPGLCGTYTTNADLYPWSDPGTPVHREATFQVNSGAGGGPCATQESQLPNKPTLEAGTLSPIAGAYSPFVFKVKREDGSQILSQVSATLPEGLLGKLAGITECSNSQIAQAEGRGGEGQGALELASPSCPASSQVGLVNVGTGVGSQPYYVGGKAYLAGPYKGAPLSLAIVTPAVVGPFDLGTIVVRTALYVNETTAQITAVSDPIPTIVHGLPTVVQSIALNMDRPNFTLNPTSCDPKQIGASATSTLGNLAPLSQRFQVGACGALGFKPNLQLSLKGSTKRAGVPALKAVLTYPKGNYSNIKSVSTVLPSSEFIDNAHIGNTCTRVQFNAGAGGGAQCPRKSILGHAIAYSPLLDQPLEGTVYFRSNGGERELPDLVAALKGQINVTLVGFIDSVGKKGAEISRVRTRFANVPDAPVSRFVLQLAGAKKGLLQNSVNLCKVKNIAQVKATAQNGKTYDTEPAVANDCGKGSKKSKGKRRK
jgi:hypothetical protein